MQLLLGYADFKAWKDTDKADQDLVEDPKSFPCWVYTKVNTWVNQSEVAVYYYPADLKAMLMTVGEGQPNSTEASVATNAIEKDQNPDFNRGQLRGFEVGYAAAKVAYHRRIGTTKRALEVAKIAIESPISEGRDVKEQTARIEWRSTALSSINIVLMMEE